MRDTETGMNISIVILAAGLGTRMRSKRAKVLHRAGGMALVEHVVAAARAIAPADRIVVVTGHQAEQVEDLLAPAGVRFARQTEQKGTGHAVECARAAIPENNGLLMVLYGDTPLLSSATLMRLRDEQASGGRGSDADHDYARRSVGVWPRDGGRERQRDRDRRRKGMQ